MSCGSKSPTPNRSQASTKEGLPLNNHDRRGGLLRVRCYEGVAKCLYGVVSFASLLVMGAWAAILPKPVRAQESGSPLEVDDVLRIRSIVPASVDLSPDGKWVTYTLINPARMDPDDDEGMWYSRSGVPGDARGTEVWVSQVATGRSIELTGARGVSWGGAWSSDGRMLAFYSDRGGLTQVWLWEAATGRVRRVSPAAAHPVFSFELPQWTPDGRRLLVKLLPEEAPTNADTSRKNRKIQVYGSTAHSVSTQADSSLLDATDLGLLAIADGAVHRVLRATPVSGYQLSPSGRQVAVTITRPKTVQAINFGYDLRIISLQDRSARTVATAVPQGFGSSFSWAPDGSALAYSTWSSDTTVPQDCYVIPLAGGSPRNVTPGKHPPFGDESRGPLWDARGEHLYLVGRDTVWVVSSATGEAAPLATVPGGRGLSIISPASGGRIWAPDSGRALYVTSEDSTTLRRAVSKIDLRTGQTELLFGEDAFFGEGGIDAVGETIVYLTETAKTSPDLWIAGSDFASRRRLTHVNAQLDRYSFGVSRLIRWQSLDGVPLQGALLLPPAYEEGRRVPLVVYLYGGDAGSQRLNRFGLYPDAIANLLVTRGYAVLAPDAPLDLGTPMLDLAKTVLPGVNRAVETGIADPDRLGITGASYGGYSTLALVVETSRFKAAVVTSSVSASLLTHYGLLREFDGCSCGLWWAESGQGRLGASPWERRDRYVENSPFFYLDRVRTPLLILQGARDYVAPVYGADELFTGLRRLGKEVEYAKYGSEGHNPEVWRTAHQRDYYTRIVKWFDSHLKASN
jgi:dipeptidyl aminopeptidase/acylaminoacyl peptidase